MSFLRCGILFFVTILYVCALLAHVRVQNIAVVFPARLCIASGHVISTDSL